jgi:hypothetical protein
MLAFSPSRLAPLAAAVLAHPRQHQERAAAAPTPLRPSLAATAAAYRTDGSNHMPTHVRAVNITQNQTQVKPHPSSPSLSF